MTARPDNLLAALSAIRNDDYRGFSRALDADRQEAGDGGVQSLLPERVILEMAPKVISGHPPTVKMFRKTVDLLSDTAPVSVMNDVERQQILRKLVVALAVSEWADDIGAIQIEQTMNLVANAPTHPAKTDNKLRANLLEASGPRSSPTQLQLNAHI